MFSVLGVVLALLCGGQIAWHGYSAHLLPVTDAHSRSISPSSALVLLAQKKFEISQKSDFAVNKCKPVFEDILGTFRIISAPLVTFSPKVLRKSACPRDGPLA